MVSLRNMVKSRFFKGLCDLLEYVNYCECLKFVLTRFDLVWACCFGVVLAFFSMNFSIFDPVFSTLVPVRPVRRSVFWGLPSLQNPVLRNSIFVMIPGNRDINSFRSFAQMSRHFLCCICCALGVPDGLVPIDRGILINYVEVLVRMFFDLHFNGAWLRRHYYALLCDATNRARWRFVVEEDFSLPLYFSRLVGYRARMEDYPSRLFYRFWRPFSLLLLCFRPTFHDCRCRFLCPEDWSNGFC